MIRAGRSCPVVCTIISRFIYVLIAAKFAIAAEFGIPIEIKLWDSKRTPLARMVDVTNEFGIKVLAEHNFLNDNNIAFSPYGLMGIVIALYEGVDGESSYQIQRSMQLPWNRNVMRIGFRDIHRTLKTYFVPEEGFLAGLALNNENVTFNEGYKKILRFYGFDLDSENSPNNATNVTQTTESSPFSSSPMSISTSVEVTSEIVTGREDTSTTQTEGDKDETTPEPNVETIGIVETNESTPETTIIVFPSSTASSSTNPIKTNIDDENTNLADLTVPPSSVSEPGSTVTMETTVTTISSTLTQTSTADVTTVDITSESTSNPDVELLTTQTMTSEINTNSNTDESSEGTTPITTTVTTESEMSSILLSETQTEATEATPTTLTTDTSTDEIPTTSSLETLERRKKSVDFLFTSPSYADDYLIYRSFDVGVELPEENVDEDKMFLVNGLRNIQVTYMQYDSVLEYAYLPHLEASALRLPLDSERYYLLVVLPLRRGSGELARLLNRMARESDLSDVYAVLQPRRVRAVVPSFTVKGHVTLTTDLQKLGIRDVFEPRQHDFTPMTPQAGVYVRSIEQAVSVAIRKYQPDDVKNTKCDSELCNEGYVQCNLSNKLNFAVGEFLSQTCHTLLFANFTILGYISSRNPVIFSATHPFLYFVMDTNIHVALMAGKMVDPLNTRIL